MALKALPLVCTHYKTACGAKGGSRVTVVYADSVFLLNGAMDYVLLLVTARLAGIPLKRRRYLLAAALGAVYAVAVFLPGMGFLSAFASKLAVGVLLALIAFGGEEKLLRLVLLLFAVSCAMAGCVLALGLLAGSRVPVSNGIFYTDVDARVLLVAVAAAYLVLTVVFRAAARHGLGGALVPVKVCVGGRTVQLTALYDSGNGLRDPAGGGAVLVTAPGSLDSVLPRSVGKLLTPELLRFPADLLEPLRAAAPALRPRLLPYRAVGVAGGLLLTIRADWVEVRVRLYDGAPVALSPTALGTGYAALWGGEVKRGGNHDRFEERTAAAADVVGTAAGGGRPLHRRQRYASAAADKGTGSRAAGPAGR